MSSIKDIVAMLRKSMQFKVLNWWYDTCATIYVCYDRSLFKTYHNIDNGREIQMKNKVIGKGNIDIIFTLTNVFHLPVINRN